MTEFEECSIKLLMKIYQELILQRIPSKSGQLRLFYLSDYIERQRKYQKLCSLSRDNEGFEKHKQNIENCLTEFNSLKKRGFIDPYEQ